MARAPLTWKNIDAPDFTRAAQIQELAARRLDKGFESAQGIVDTLGTHQDDVHERNTADFKNRLMQQYQTPEAMRAAQGSGEIQALRDRYAGGGGLDPAQSGVGEVNTLIDASQTRVDANTARDRAQYQFDRGVMSNNRADEALRKSVAQTAYNKEWDKNVYAKNYDALEQMMDSEYANVAEQGPKLNALKKGQLTDSLLSSALGEYDTSFSNAIEARSAQENFEKQWGVDFKTLAADPAQIANLPQEAQKAVLTFSDQWAEVYDPQVDPQVQHAQLRKDFEAFGESRAQAKLSADALMLSIDQQRQMPVALEKRYTAAKQDLANRVYGDNSLVQGHAQQPRDIKFADLLDGDGKKIFDNLSGEGKKQLDTFMGYVKDGFIPPNKKIGNKTAIPLTTELAKYIINSTDTTGSGFKDFFSWGTNNTLDRAEDLINNGVFTKNELQGFESYIQEITALDSELQYKFKPHSTIDAVPSREQINKASEGYIKLADSVSPRADLPISGDGSNQPAPLADASYGDVVPLDQIRREAVAAKAQVDDLAVQQFKAQQSGDVEGAGALYDELRQTMATQKGLEEEPRLRSEIEGMRKVIAEVEEQIRANPSQSRTLKLRLAGHQRALQEDIQALQAFQNARTAK